MWWCYARGMRCGVWGQLQRTAHGPATASLPTVQLVHSPCLALLCGRPRVSPHPAQAVHPSTQVHSLRQRDFRALADVAGCLRCWLAVVFLLLCWWQLPTSLRRLRRWLVSDWVHDAACSVVSELVSAAATSRPCMLLRWQTPRLCVVSWLHGRRACGWRHWHA